MTRRALVPLSHLAVLLATCAIAGAARADRERDLAELREAIRAGRERVAAYESEQRGLLVAIEALDRALAKLRRASADASSLAESANATLEDVDRERIELTRRLDATRRAMSSRAVALYKTGALGPVQLVFASEGFRDFLARVDTLRLLLDHDAELLARFRAQSEDLAAVEERAHRALANRDEALADLRARLRERSAEREARRHVVASLHEDRAGARAALAELENAARAFEETLATLGDRAASGASPEGPPFETLRAQLDPPVAAPIAEGFGRVVDAEFHTETFRRGVAFGAQEGEPVRAVANGQVRFAGWFRGFGRLVILDHGDDWFTVSGHLAEIEVEVGDQVPARGVIGSVGDTGSLVGPRLYFEIRHGGEPQDPERWLRTRGQG